MKCIRRHTKESKIRREIRKNEIMLVTAVNHN